MRVLLQLYMDNCADTTFCALQRGLPRFFYRLREMMNQMYGKYQLREAAGFWWLIDMTQTGEDFAAPLQLNETGAMLFRGLCEGLDEEELADRLASGYGLLVKEAREDVAAFAAQLAANGIRFV